MKTFGLTGAALDWAVANCEGLLAFGFRKTDRFIIELSDGELEEFCPSGDWAQGGPIIEREKIDVVFFEDEMCWEGNIYNGSKLYQFGPTPLIAAMRCYVASKMGHTVNVPEELCLHTV
jgi:hypothetical protein